MTTYIDVACWTYYADPGYFSGATERIIFYYGYFSDATLWIGCLLCLEANLAGGHILPTFEKLIDAHPSHLTLLGTIR